MPHTIIKSSIIKYRLDDITPNFEIDKQRFTRQMSCFDEVDLQ
jgi:hypothetical protein